MSIVPKIGMRNIKTAIAVLVCLLTNIFLQLINSEFAKTFYTPFFAGIAACYSMQQNSKMSIKNAKIRGIGTVVGGLYGMVVILFAESVCHYIGNSILEGSVKYLIISIAIVPLIYLSVIGKFTAATFITCLTYLSVTVSLRNAGMEPVPFAFNRIGSTLYGLSVSLIVNIIWLPKRKNKRVLFLTGLDGTILNNKQELTGFVKYKLNSMIYHGANIAVATTRTPASLIKIFDGVKMRQPMIIMNGAAVYSFNDHKFNNVKSIEQKTRVAIDDYFRRNRINVFTHVILDDVLHIYHQQLSNDGEMKYYYDRKNDYFKNYIRGEANIEDKVCFYIAVNTLENVQRIQNDIYALVGADEVVVTIYPYNEIEGYYNLKIHSKDVSKQNAIAELNLKNAVDYVVAFGCREYDISMMKNADYSIALETADADVKDIADMIIPSDDPERLIKEMEKIFYLRKKHMFKAYKES